MDEAWYRTFFTGLVLDFWRAANPPEVTRAEADFLAAELKAAPGAALLDVPCGNGRLAVELAGRGYAATGVDQSESFIAEARAAASAAGLAVAWRCGDMRDLPWRGRFGGAFCFGNSFGYLDPAATRVFFAAVADSLATGGRFVLDTLVAAESLLPDLAHRTWMRVEGMHLLIENTYEACESRLETRYTFFAAGRQEVRTAHHWVFTTGEIGRMLEEVGLVPLAWYEDLGRQPFLPGSPRLLLVAQKLGPAEN